MIRHLYLIGALLLLMLVGCDQAGMINKMMTPQDEATARGYIDLVRQNKLEQIEKDIDPSIKNADLHDGLVKMATLIPSQDPEAIKVVGVQIFNSKDSSRTNITFEYKFPSKWLLMNVAVQKKAGVSTIVGFHVNPIPDSLENLNRFTFAGKRPLHYVVFSLAIMLSLFSLYALVQCVRTKIERRKWLWIIFIILGVGKFSVNWTTGQWSVTPLAVQFLSAAAFAPFYGPWVISISLPLGAIVFLLRRGTLRKGKMVSEPPEVS